jgi:hypothetical protein
VTYSAPEVNQNTTVRITASFEGTQDFLESIAGSQGAITPEAVVMEYEYEMTFEKMVISNAKLEGPFAMLGTSVTRITGTTVDTSKLSLSPLGLNITDVVFQDLEIYATYLNAFSPELGKGLEYDGVDKVSISMASITLENGEASFLELISTNAELTEAELTGKYVGGSEPYMPVILNTSSTVLKKYLATGPVTYGELVDKAWNLTITTIEASDFSFTSPLEYSLNRQTNEYSYKGKWTMSSSKVTGANALLDLIYFRSPYGGIVVQGTGEERPRDVLTIWGITFYVGSESPPIDAEAHVIHFKADRLLLENMLLQISP